MLSPLRRWNASPNFLPSIDWSNPATLGLKNFFVFLTPGLAFDLVKRKLYTITASFGTPTMRAIPGGVALYTGNGAGAQIDVGEDWSGPSTTLWSCWIYGVDSNFGGLWTKNTTGTTAQLSMGRNSTSDDWYLGAADSGTQAITASSIAGDLNKQIVMAYTLSAASSGTARLYTQGKEVGSAIFGFTQGTGTGTLRLGQERSGNASFDSDVAWLSFLRFDRELNAGVIAEISRDVNRLLTPKYVDIAINQIAAATTPILSALSAINVTASSAQPRITYTF